MICHKWSFRWEKEARVVWEGGTVLEAAQNVTNLREKPKKEPTTEEYKAKIQADEEAQKAAVERVKALDSTTATDFVEEAATHVAEEHKTAIDAIAAEDLAEKSRIQQEASTQVEQIADLGTEVTASSQTLDTATVETLSRTANVQIINAQDVADAEEAIPTNTAKEKRDQLVTEKILTNVLNGAVNDAQVKAILAKDPQYAHFISEKPADNPNITDRPKLIEKIIKKELKDVKLAEGDMLIFKEQNGKLFIEHQKSEDVRAETERQTNILPTPDGPAQKLMQEYQVGVTKTPTGAKLTLPPESKIDGNTNAIATEYAIPDYATDIKINGNAEKKELTVEITTPSGAKETKTIKLPEKTPINTENFGKLTENSCVESITFEGDWKEAQQAMEKNRIKFLPEGKYGKFMVGDSRWSIDGDERSIAIRSDSPDGTKCTITLRGEKQTQTLTIENGKVIDNVFVSNDGATVLRKTPGVDGALRKADVTLDGTTLQTKQGRIDMTQGGTLTNTEISMDGDTVVVRGINAKGEIVRVGIDPKTEPKKEDLKELPHPNVTYDKDAKKMLDAQGFANGEIHFYTEKNGDKIPHLRLQTDEIPDDAKIIAEGERKITKREIAQRDFQDIASFALDKKGPKNIEITLTHKDGTLEKVTVEFTETAAKAHHKEKKAERAEKKDLKDGRTNPPEQPGEPMPTAPDQPTIEAMQKIADKVPNESKTISIDRAAGKIDEQIAGAQAKKDLMMKTCTAVLGPEFNFYKYTTSQQSELTKNAFLCMQTEIYEDTDSKTIKAEFRTGEGSANSKETCMAKIKELSDSFDKNNEKSSIQRQLALPEGSTEKINALNDNQNTWITGNTDLKNKFDAVSSAKQTPISKDKVNAVIKAEQDFLTALKAFCEKTNQSTAPSEPQKTEMQETLAVIPGLQGVLKNAASIVTDSTAQTVFDTLTTNLPTKLYPTPHQ